MKIKTSLTLVLLVVGFASVAQLGKKGLPDDLNTSKIVFLRLDSAEEFHPKSKDRAGKEMANNRKKHNKKVQDANEELMKSSKKYPYQYTIAYRSALDNCKAHGYKYVLDFQPFIKMKEGEMTANEEVTSSFPLYLCNLNTKEVFIVEDIDQYFTYRYADIIEKVFLKEVKKKYKYKIK